MSFTQNTIDFLRFQPDYFEQTLLKNWQFFPLCIGKKKFVKSFITTHIFIPQRSKNMHIPSWISNKSAFKEGDVEDGGIKVDELEQEHFERQIVIEFGLGSMHFCKRKES